MRVKLFSNINKKIWACSVFSVVNNIRYIIMFNIRALFWIKFIEKNYKWSLQIIFTSTTSGIRISLCTTATSEISAFISSALWSLENIDSYVLKHTFKHLKTLFKSLLLNQLYEKKL